MSASEKDVEDAMEWLQFGAPPISEKPWAPVATSLPDPEVLAIRPPSNPQRILLWLTKTPIDFCLHALAYVSMLIVLSFSLKQSHCHFERMLRFLAGIFGFLALFSLWKRFLLYREALKYQIYQKATLASVTYDRLRYRRYRYLPLLFCLLHTCLLLRLRREKQLDDLDSCLCCLSPSSETDKIELASSLLNSFHIGTLAVATFLLFLCTFYISADPIEDAAIRLASSQHAAATRRRQSAPSSSSSSSSFYAASSSQKHHHFNHHHT